MSAFEFSELTEQALVVSPEPGPGALGLSQFAEVMRPPAIARASKGAVFALDLARILGDPHRKAKRFVSTPGDGSRSALAEEEIAGARRAPEDAFAPWHTPLRGDYPRSVGTPNPASSRCFPHNSFSRLTSAAALENSK